MIHTTGTSLFGDAGCVWVRGGQWGRARRVFAVDEVYECDKAIVLMPMLLSRGLGVLSVTLVGEVAPLVRCEHSKLCRRRQCPSVARHVFDVSESVYLQGHTI